MRKLLNGLLMLFCITGKSDAENLSNYTSISDNNVESKSFEIRKIIDVGIAREIFFDTKTRTYFLKRELYPHGKFDVWKISEDGYLIETMSGVPDPSVSKMKEKGSSLVMLVDIISNFYKWDNSSQKIFMSKFVKEGSKSAPLLNFTGAWEGKYGTGYLQINHGGEQIKFKSFTGQRRRDKSFDPGLQVYILPENIKKDSGVLFIQLTNSATNDRRSDGLGVYVLRRKREGLVLQ